MRQAIIKATQLFDTPAPEPKRPGATGDKCKIRPAERLVFVCENMDLTIYDSEVEAVIADWKAGLHLADIAERIGRDPDEMAIIIIGLGHRGRLGERPGGYAGCAM